MTVKGRGNQWQKPGFSVFMNTNGESDPDKCLSCKKSPGQPNQKCKPCKFVNRGYVLKMRKG